MPHDLDEKLTVLIFHHLDKKFIKKLNKGIHNLVKDAKADHDLARTPSMRQYHN